MIFSLEETAEISLFALGGVEVPGSVDAATFSSGVAIVFVETAPELSLVASMFIPKPVVSKRLWFFTIKSIDGLGDITIPMASYSESINWPNKASYSVVIPNGPEYLSDIVARQQSSFVIVAREIYIDGTYADTNSTQADITSVRSDEGGNNHSITIIGSKEFENPTPKKLKVNGVSYHSVVTGGAQTLRAENDKDFLGGDTAILPDGSEIIVGVVTRMISVNNQTMQLSELK